jgi:hypothetical protein
MAADARQTDFCTYLSGILLGGLLLNAFFGLWWADPMGVLSWFRSLQKKESPVGRGGLALTAERAVVAAKPLREAGVPPSCPRRKLKALR